MLLTIHQPSPSIYDLFDRIIMLHYGRVCYFGDGFSSPIAFFAQQARTPTIPHPSLQPTLCVAYPLSTSAWAEAMPAQLADADRDDRAPWVKSYVFETHFELLQLLCENRANRVMMSIISQRLNSSLFTFCQATFEGSARVKLGTNPVRKARCQYGPRGQWMRPGPG